MTPERAEKIKRVAAKRQHDLAVIIENVHDPHNIFAVVRTCDSVGVQDVYVIDTHNIFFEKTVYGNKSSASSMKWVNIHIYPDHESCIKDVRKKYATILGTHLSKGSVSLFEIDLTQPVALLFGNEKDGLSDEILQFCDQNFMIPQVGMTKSLNISVACAVSLYEAFRQREAKGYYESPRTNPENLKELFEDLSSR